MQCPLLTMATKAPLGRAGFLVGDCGGDKCAWFDATRGRCVMLSMAKELGELWRSQDNLAREINQAVTRK